MAPRAALLALSQLAGVAVLAPLVAEERGRREVRAVAQPAQRTCSFRGDANHDPESEMSDEVQSGLEGVVAFATEIAEPDKEGGALRYRGVDIEDLVGTCRSRRSGACSSTAVSTRASRRPSRTR